MTNNLALMCTRSIWVLSLGDRAGLLTVMRKERNLTGMKNLRSCRRVDLGTNYKQRGNHAFLTWVYTACYE